MDLIDHRRRFMGSVPSDQAREIANNDSLSYVERLERLAELEQETIARDGRSEAPEVRCYVEQVKMQRLAAREVVDARLIAVVEVTALDLEQRAAAQDGLEYAS